MTIRHLNKTFGPVKVLEHVDFSVRPGEVHGLAGQNGSGKSTLVKILTGLYTPDAGAVIEVDQRQIRLPVRWGEVHGAGVSVVHQDLGLLDELSVADNICVGGYPYQRVTRRIDRRRQRDKALSALRRIGSEIDTSRMTGTLSAPERAEVAIARALRDHESGTGLVIMDETTRSMTGADLSRVHRILRTLASEGTSVILISHSLPELLAVTDRVTILRDGRVSGGGLLTSGLTEQQIAHRMLGSNALGTDLVDDSADSTDRAPRSAEPAVVVTELDGDRVHEVSFAVDPGEIVGITGVPGSGYEDIPYLMTGAIRARRGRLRTGILTLDLAKTSIASCLRAGLVLVPEQRARHGLAMELSVRDNITLPNIRRYGRPWFLGSAWQKRESEAAVRTFGIRPENTNRLVKTLSGGNQQKALLAKWLGGAPAVMVLHEPTQAVDVGARRDILLAIRSAAEQGVSVVLVSGEPSDLVAICSRVYLSRPEGGLVEVESTTTDELLEQIYSPQADDQERR